MAVKELKIHKLEYVDVSSDSYNGNMVEFKMINMDIDEVKKFIDLKRLGEVSSFDLAGLEFEGVVVGLKIYMDAKYNTSMQAKVQSEALPHIQL